MYVYICAYLNIYTFSIYLYTHTLLEVNKENTYLQE